MNSTYTTEPSGYDSDADPMIDALLSEFVPSDPGRRSPPPDLTAQILSRLADGDAPPVTTTRPALTGVEPAAADSRPVRTVALAMSVLLGVAACFFLLMHLAGVVEPPP